MDGANFYENVSRKCLEKGITQTKMCDDLEVNVQSWRNSQFLKRIPTTQTLIKFADYFDVSIDWLMGHATTGGIATPSQSFLVPVFDQKLSAGHGSLLSDCDSAVGFIPVPESLRRFGRSLASMYVSGDSMEPTIFSGDLIICDTNGWDGEGVYVLQLNGDGFIKRVSKTSTSWVIISDNPKYPVREERLESECIRIIGKVHELFHHIG